MTVEYKTCFFSRLVSKSLAVQFDTVAVLETLLETLADRLDRLELELKNKTLLHRKDLMQRYGITPSTLHRRLRAGRLPAPIRLGGPVWRLADLEAIESAGQADARASAVRLKQGGNSVLSIRPVVQTSAGVSHPVSSY